MGEGRGERNEQGEGRSQLELDGKTLEKTQYTPIFPPSNIASYPSPMAPRSTHWRQEVNVPSFQLWANFKFAPLVTKNKYYYAIQY